MKIKTLQPEFVESFPELLEEGTLYISEKFSIAGHKCCCGCREEVITPLNGAQWQVRRDGGLVSLHPSIGNWKFACKSHYWIRKNRVVDAPALPGWAINRVKKRDCQDKDIRIQKINRASGFGCQSIQKDQASSANHYSQSRDVSVLEWLRKWWLGE